MRPCTSATIRSDVEIVAIRQLMATVGISQPRLETCVASQMKRKGSILERRKRPWRNYIRICASHFPHLCAFAFRLLVPLPWRVVQRDQHSDGASFSERGKFASTTGHFHPVRHLPAHARAHPTAVHVLRNLPIHLEEPLELNSIGKLYFCLSARFRYVLVVLNPLIVRC